jgi:hypothetical protein
MKKISSLTLASFVAVLVVFAFCVSFAVAGGGEDKRVYKKVTEQVHKKNFPDGHGPGAGCYYDEEEHAYFCAYAAEEEKAAKKEKAEVVYQRIEGAEYRGLHPETKGRAAAASGCYYQESQDEYFCGYEAEVQLEETRDIMHISGAPVYKMVPKAAHEKAYPKGHDKGIPCFYDEEEGVYFCAHAD